MAPRDQPEREVGHGEVGIGALLPADQDAAEAVEPGMGALHHPPPRLGAGVALGSDLLAARAQVQGEAERLGPRPRLVIAHCLTLFVTGQADCLTGNATRCGW